MNLKYKIQRRHWTGYYYSHLFLLLYPLFTRGILAQNYIFWIFCDSLNLLANVFLLKHWGLTQAQALLDITVIDQPEAIDGRFGLIYSFWSYNRSLRFFLKTFTHCQNPINSITKYFLSSDWLEREAWDLFGIKFLNHRDLRRILTDYGFRGHPFRKDFPLMGYLEIRYEDSFRNLIFEPVELSQEFRLFKFEMPWSLWPAK